LNLRGESIRGEHQDAQKLQKEKSLFGKRESTPRGKIYQGGLGVAGEEVSSKCEEEGERLSETDPATRASDDGKSCLRREEGGRSPTRAARSNRFISMKGEPMTTTKSEEGP